MALTTPRRLDPVLYVERSHVRTDLLRRTDMTSWCNYKGPATYWAAVIGDNLVDDVAWTYEEPLPESTRIKGHFSFELNRTRVIADLPVGP
jgi:uncharacterized protein (DUF427 family)